MKWKFKYPKALINYLQTIGDFYNNRELQQITSNHSSDIDFKDFVKLYKDYAKDHIHF